jgi:ACR3 family arsenite efflux pump ArsB
MPQSHKGKITGLSLGPGALVAITGFMKNHMGISGFVAMAAGVIVGKIVELEALRYLIPVALFLMLYPSMLDVRPEGLAAVLTEPRLPIMLTYLKIAQTRMKKTDRI